MEPMLKRIFTSFTAGILSLSMLISTTPVMAEEAAPTDADYDALLEISTLIEDESELDEFEELELTTEAEPGDLPEETEDDQLTDQLEGEMLLQVEGSGEVYYVDPVDGGKEYLADGEAAYRLLRRRALGITNANLERIPEGVERSDSNRCTDPANVMGRRLRGRILLQVEEHGEAWYVWPTNCRRYYVGTYDRAYQIMKKLSLGVTNRNLARIRNARRQRIKMNLRHYVHFVAEKNDMTIDEAIAWIKEQLKGVRACYRTKLGELDRDTLTNARRVKAHLLIQCLRESDLPALRRPDREEAIRRLRSFRDNLLDLRASALQVMCVRTGGTWAEETCTCPDNYSLDKNTCKDADGMFGGELGDQVRQLHDRLNISQ